MSEYQVAYPISANVVQHTLGIEFTFLTDLGANQYIYPFYKTPLDVSQKDILDWLEFTEKNNQSINKSVHFQYTTPEEVKSFLLAQRLKAANTRCSMFGFELIKGNNTYSINTRKDKSLLEHKFKIKVTNNTIDIVQRVV